MKNTKYAKLLPDGNIEYADSVLHGKFSVVINPSEKEYRLHGYYPKVDEQPASTSDFYYVRDKWVQEDDCIRAVYRKVMTPKHDEQKPEANFLQKALRKIAFKMIGTY